MTRQSLSQTTGLRRRGGHRDGGGIGAVRRISAGHPNNLGVRLKMNLPNHVFADFSFEIAAAREGTFIVSRERCIVEQLFKEDRYQAQNGEFTTQVPGIRAKIEPDRRHRGPSSTSRTLRVRASGVNGFWRRGVPHSSTSWRTVASSM